MKKSYILIAVLIVLAAGVFYFRGAQDNNNLAADKNTITIPEGIQSQFGDLRIGVASISEDNPAAVLAVADLKSSSNLNVVSGNSYTVGKYEIYVKEIALGSEKLKRSITLRITSEVDKNPVIINNVASLPPTDTEKKVVAYAFAYLDTLYGTQGENWQYVSADRAVIGDRVYDKVTIKLAGGPEEVVHFDVTAALRQIAKRALENLADITFSKNGGEKIEDAILIRGAKSDKAGVDSEYVYLDAKYGLKGLDWELKQQTLLKENGRDYDKMDLKFSDGTEKTIYFDITEFFGKGVAE